MEGLTNLYKALQSLICIFSWPRGQGSRGKGNARARENLHCAIYQSPEANGGEWGGARGPGHRAQGPGTQGTKGERPGAQGPGNLYYLIFQSSGPRGLRGRRGRAQGPGPARSPGAQPRATEPRAQSLAEGPGQGQAQSPEPKAQDPGAQVGRARPDPQGWY